MKQILKIDGGFSPISVEQINSLRSLHQRYPKKILVLNPPEESFYENLLLDSLEKMPYCWLASERFHEFDYSLRSQDVELCLANLHSFPKNVIYSIYHTPTLVESLVKKMISEKRFLHSLSVAKTAQELAVAHKYDVHQAYLAGILHDCLKDYSEAENDAWLQYFDAEKLNSPSPIKHGYAAKYFLRHAGSLRNNDILNAIYHHSDGKSNSLLSKILYIADKREPLRGIEDHFLDLAMKDIHVAFKELQKDVENFRKEKQHA